MPIDPLPLRSSSETEIETRVSQSKQSTAGDYAVYVLDCTPPEHDRDFRVDSIIEHTKSKISRHESLTCREEAAKVILDGGTIYYVGSTNDVVDRIKAHSKGASAGGAAFLNLYSPMYLVDIHWYPTEVDARRNEPKIAEDIASRDNCFAYWN